MCLLLLAWLGSVVGLKPGNNEGIKLGFYDRKVVGTKIGAVAGVNFGTYVDLELGYLESSTGGAADGNFDGLLDHWMNFRLEQMKVMN